MILALIVAGGFMAGTVFGIAVTFHRPSIVEWKTTQPAVSNNHNTVVIRREPDPGEILLQRLHAATPARKLHTNQTRGALER